MTRFARGGEANKKKPHEGSSWDELKQTEKQSEACKTSEKVNKSEKSPDKQSHGDRGGMKQKKHTKLEVSSAPVKESAKRVKKERERERRRLKRKQDRDEEKVCYNCRKPGHHLADCAQVKRDHEQGTGICFKCGSTEHSSGKCHVKVPPGEYPFAKCFVCGEKGHISKQCPDNPRGLYPKGGCCKHCSSVEHFRKDCPELQKEQGIQDVRLETMSGSKSADAQDEFTEPYIPVKKKKKKVVNF